MCGFAHIFLILFFICRVKYLHGLLIYHHYVWITLLKHKTKFLCDCVHNFTSQKQMQVSKSYVAQSTTGKPFHDIISNASTHCCQIQQQKRAFHIVKAKIMSRCITSQQILLLFRFDARNTGC